MKKIYWLTLFILSFLWTGNGNLNAQVNAQLFYDFGSDRKFATLTLEMFKGDKWGNTYFFVDHDFNYNDHVEGPNLAPGGTYMEIARCLNFWQGSPVGAFSLHVEYNGGITRSYPINNAWLFGIDYFLHDATFKNTLNLKALYKTIRKHGSSVPMQLTAVWSCQDLFGLKGVTFCGFADFWWEDHACDYQADGSYTLKKSVFLTEPQLWYNIGHLAGCDNLHVGTEIELSNHFGSVAGFRCRPCLGAKWIF